MRNMLFTVVVTLATSAAGCAVDDRDATTDRAQAEVAQEVQAHAQGEPSALELGPMEARQLTDELLSSVESQPGATPNLRNGCFTQGECGGCCWNVYGDVGHCCTWCGDAFGCY